MTTIHYQTDTDPIAFIYPVAHNQWYGRYRIGHHVVTIGPECSAAVVEAQVPANYTPRRGQLVSANVRWAWRRYWRRIGL